MRIPSQVGNFLRVLATITALVVGPVALSAQSLTSGALRGAVRASDGTAIRRAKMTLEARLGGTVREFESDVDGSFDLGLLPVGEYRILVEQQGYQPIRLTGVTVSAGEATVLTATLERKPPPITSVVELAANATRVGSANGRVIGIRELESFDLGRDVAGGLRGSSEIVWPTDGRAGLAIASAGLPSWHTRVLADGVLQPAFRHLGLRSEPSPVPLLERDAVGQARLIGAPLDAEWRSTTGSLLAVQTRTASDRIIFAPFVRGSTAKLGRPVDNPLDSTTISFQAGAVLSGPIVRDTAHFLLRFTYQSIEQPTAFPWEQDDGTYRGSPVSLRATIPSIGTDSFATSLGSHVSPPVRTWKGATGLGKLDWNISPTSRVQARVSFASWREGTPQVGEALSTSAQALLSNRDFGGTIGITTAGGRVSNELRAGFAAGRREFAGNGLPETTLVGEGLAFGGSSLYPALFDAKTLDVSDAVQIIFGSHRLKGGGSLTATSYVYDYRFGSAGIFHFGGLDQFGAGTGFFYQATGAEEARFTGLDAGVFVQDTWQAAPDLELIAGFRFDVSPLPKNKISFNQDWFQAIGVRNDSIPNDYSGFSPRIGFVWDVLNRGEWVLRGGLGLHHGRLDPQSFGEAMLYDGGVEVRRGRATFASWPALPDEALAPTVGPALTILNPTYRGPRTIKAETGITRAMANGLTVHVTGSYHHTDFLLRRTDLNRVIGPVGTTQEGRPVFGRLVQEGGLVATQPKSNRRFDDFDLVSGLSPTGISEHYELTAIVERQLSNALSISAAYTFSRTTDDLVGARSIDPADQLSPFPGGIDGVNWDRGRSDFDVPHRGAATAEYRSSGRNPIGVAVRYRVRSGLPFTPGFRPGVDLNGDGSGGNDPVHLDASTANLSEALNAGSCSLALSGRFADRNACRERIAHSLDAHLSFGLPVGATGRRIALEVDGFNLIGTATGIVDRAAVLIDRTRTLITDGAGNVNVPLVANPRFGSLLVRRGEPRIVRVGVRMEY